MARLETQINQIYLTDPEQKKNSLILYEEQINNSLQLFMVAELWNIQKKSEAADLKKISEIILASFRSNKKLPAESLFETSLSQINQNLADLAHSGRKSWVGKFSCLICVKGLDNNIYLANNGQTSAWLKRRHEMMEVLPSEKRGNHPLKTFINFTQGKLADQDCLILTTSNIFNYISFELFSKILNQHPVDEASDQITKILKDSASTEVSFSSFLLHFSKKAAEEAIIPPIDESGIYAPLPEDIQQETIVSRPKFKLPAITVPKISVKLPNINWEWLNRYKLPYFQNLSRAGKFFFISFAVFLILFLINLGIYTFKLKDKKAQSRAEQLMEQINTDLAQTNSALIYKDENEAIEKLNQAIADLEELASINPVKAEEISPKVEQVKTVVNKINTVLDPKVQAELRHKPIFLATATSGILMSGTDSNTLSLYSNNELQDYFLLNSLHEPIVSIGYFSPSGVITATSQDIYRVDNNLKQFEKIISLNGEIKSIKTANSAVYTLLADRISKTSSKLQTQTSISGDFSDVRDFGVDKDFYLLYPDRIIKYVSGQPQSFPLPNMTDSLTNADRIFVGANLYILESNKKRLIVLNKNGALVNQMYFPTTEKLNDFLVEEQQRNIYLLGDNKLYKITF